MPLQAVAAYFMVTLLFGPTAAMAGEDDPTLRQTLLTEGPAQWEEYTDFAKKLCGTAEFKLTVGGKGEAHTKIEVRQNLRFKLYSSDSLLQNGRGSSVSAYNQDYGFEIRKKQGANAWVVTRLDTEPPLDASTSVREVDSGCRNYGARLLSLNFRETLPGLFRGGSFRLLSVSRIDIGGVRLVRATFESRRG
jgi:hypothetical protein